MTVLDDASGRGSPGEPEDGGSSRQTDGVGAAEAAFDATWVDRLAAASADLETLAALTWSSADAPLVPDSPAEIAFLDGLDQLATLVRRMDALKLAVTAAVLTSTPGDTVATSLARRVGRRSPAALLGAALGVGQRRAGDWITAAKALGDACDPGADLATAADIPPWAGALAGGEITFEQADTLRRELRAPADPPEGLPRGVPDPTAAERELHALAGRALARLAAGHYADAGEHRAEANALADAGNPAESSDPTGPDAPTDATGGPDAGGATALAPTDADALVDQALGPQSHGLPISWSHPFTVEQLRVEARRWSAVLNSRTEEAAEERQFDDRRLDLHELPDGSWRITGHAPKLEGAVLAAFIDAASAPRATKQKDESAPMLDGSAPSDDTSASASDRSADQPADGRSRGQIGFDVFYLLARRYLSGDMAATTSLRPAATLVLTATLESLVRYFREQEPHRQSPQSTTDRTLALEPPAGAPPTDEAGMLRWLLDGRMATSSRSRRPLSMAATMELLCLQSIELCVTDGRGQPLELKRLKREFSPAQKRALWLRDRRCRAPGCTLPAMWCECHHARHWKQGGNTDVDNGILLCPAHHHELHAGRLRLIARTPTPDDPTPWRVVPTYEGIVHQHRIARAGTRASGTGSAAQATSQDTWSPGTS